jgi:hypothetical protein
VKSPCPDPCPGHGRKCGGHTAGHTPCGNFPVHFANVCRAHGAGARQVRKAAERRQTVAAAETAVRRLATVAGPAQPVTDPLSALASLAGEALRLKNLLAEMASELEDIRYRGVTGEQVHGVFTAYRQAMMDLNTILTGYARLNIDERLVQIEEARADLLAEVIRSTLADPDLNLSIEQAAVAPAVVARHLRAVAS